MEPLPEPPPSPAAAILNVCRQLADEKITLAEAVADAATRRASLDKLDAELLSRLVGALCDGLLAAAKSALATLDLSSNRIGSGSGATLAKVLSSSKIPLARLDLSTNSLGAEGAAALASALVTNQSLLGLSLADNGLEAEGATGLGWMAEDLNSQGVTGDAAAATAELGAALLDHVGTELAALITEFAHHPLAAGTHRG